MDKNLSNSVGKLGIVAIEGCEEMADKIDFYLKEWRECNDETNTFQIKPIAWATSHLSSRRSIRPGAAKRFFLFC